MNEQTTSHANLLLLSAGFAALYVGASSIGREAVHISPGPSENFRLDPLWLVYVVFLAVGVRRRWGATATILGGFVIPCSVGILLAYREHVKIMPFVPAAQALAVKQQVAIAWASVVVPASVAVTAWALYLGRRRPSSATEAVNVQSALDG